MPRLFFALVPPAQAAAALAGLAAQAARTAHGRTPRAENLHLTLAFLGEVAPERMPALHEIGASAATCAAPFVLTLDEVGMFRGAGIAWVAPRLVPAGMPVLFEALKAGLGTAGLRVEERAFHPHLTLARRCTRRLAGLAVEAVAWRVDAVTLMASVTRTDGPRYSELASWPLTG